jgi:hypothetical protein
MPSQGTREQTMNIRQMIEKFYEYNVPAYFCFLDYTKAFDTAQWEHLWYILREMGTPQHLVRLTYNLYIVNQSYVWIEKHSLITSKFQKEFNRGVFCHISYSMYMESG